MKEHLLKRLPLLLLVILALSPLTSLAIDAPHNTANTISCNSCHDSSLPDSPLLNGSDINNFCTANCHFEPSNPYTSTSAPKVLTHSSATTSTTYGVWTKLCTDCHDPHAHNQKNWKKSNAADLYLVSGSLNSFVDNGDGTTDITYSSGTFKSGWTAVNILQKTSAERGGILLPNVKKLGFTYVLTDMTDNGEANGSKTGIITVKGDLSPAYQYISTPTTFAITLGQFLKQYIDTDDNGTDETPVKLLDKSGSFSYGMGNGSGICEVCHTQTKHFRKNGTGGIDPDHTNMGSVVATNCMNCHAHASGFKGLGHKDTHFTWAAVGGTDCTYCHTNNGNGVVNDAHGNNCSACHSSIPPSRNNNAVGNATNGVDGDATVAQAEGIAATANGDLDHVIWQQPTCAHCHTGYDLSTIHHDSKNNYAADGNCTQCHEDSKNYAGDHTALVTLPTNCDDCHSGTEGTAGPVFNISVSAANNMKHDSCLDCHNADANGTLKAAYGVAQAMPDGGAGSNNGGGSCLVCHTTVAADFTAHGNETHTELTGTGTNCIGCHSGDLITGNKIHALSLANDAAAGNNTANACLDCHLNTTADGSFVTGTGASTPWGTTSVGVSNAGAIGSTRTCNTCHSTYATTFGYTGGAHKEADHSGISVAGSTCTGCHAGDKITGVHDRAASGGSASCTKCHTNVTSNGTLRAGTKGSATGHVLGTNSTCNDCHTEAKGGPSDNFDGGAHASPTHANVAGAATHCTGCHTGNVVDVVHSTTTTANNTAATCTDCHNDPLNADGSLLAGTEKTIGQGGPYGATQVGDAKNLHTIGAVSSCNTCHSALGGGTCYFEDNKHQNRHSRLTFSFNNTCVNCHDSGSVGTETYLIATIHGTTGCGNCHNATTHVPEAKTNADASVGIGGATLECLGCHGGQGSTDNYTARFQDAHDVKDHSGVATSANCVGCHTGDKITGTYTHNNNCQACHTNTTTNGTLVDGAVGTATGDVGDATGHTIGSSSTCDDCHTVAKGGPSGDFDGGSHSDYDHSGLGNTASCVTCHTGNMITAVHNNNCNDCHTNIVANGSLVAGTVATTYLGATNVGTAAGHALGTTSTCANCHAAYATNYTNHLQNHANHAEHAAHLTNTSGATDYCYDCHKFADDVNGDGVGTRMITDIHGNECDNCHTPTTGVLHNGSLAASYDTTTKHGDATASFVHSGSRACVTCHTKDANGTLIDGESHAVQNLASLQTAHNNIGTVASCSSCHEDDNAAERLALHMSATTNTINCLTCHTDTDVIGGKSAVTTVNEGKSVLNGGTNTAKTCSSCHAAKGDNSLHGLTEATANDAHTNFGTSHAAEKQCSNCHLMTSSQQSLDLHPLCTTCHERHATGSLNKTVVINNGREAGHVVGGGAGVAKNCESCHTTKYTGANNELAYQLHGLTPDTGADGVADLHNNFGASNAGVSELNCNNCHEDDDAAERLALHPLCTTCHTTHATDSTGVTKTIVINDGRATGQHVGQGSPAQTGAQTKYCESCHTAKAAYSLHGLTSSTVSDVHDNFSTSNHTAERNCSNCHTMITAQQRIALHSACSTCHTRHQPDSTGVTKTIVINDGRETGHKVGQGTPAQTGGQTKYCESCHTAKGVYALHGLSDDNTDTGNGVNDTVVDIHDNFNSSTGTTPTYTGKLSGSYGGLKVTAYNCADCHSANRTGITDQEAMYLHTRENQVNNGVGYGDCRTCHTANDIKAEVANGRYDRANASTPVAGLGNNQTIECEDCHKTAYDANSPSGQKMYQYDGVRHHTTAHAQAGDCTYCHADPRPSTPTQATGYASTATAASSDNGVSTYNNGWVNASDFSMTAPTGGIPKQPACRLCHTNYGTDGAGAAWSVNTSGGNGNHGYNIDGYSGTAAQRTTGLTVYANDYNAGLSGAANNTTATVNATRMTQTVLNSHRIAPNTGSNMIKVYDYGACLGCHSVNVMHAAPIPAQDYPAPTNNIQVAPWDTLRYAPGRAVFNLLRGANPTSYENPPSAWNQHRLQASNGLQDMMGGSSAYKTRGKSYISVSQGGTGWYFNGQVSGTTSLTNIPLHASVTNFNNQTGQAAAVDGVKFADIAAPASLDSIHIARAYYNGTTVEVWAYSGIGSGQTFSFTYTGGGCGTTAMGWDAADGRYEGTCNTPSGWTDGSDTVTVSNTTTASTLDFETTLVDGFTPAAAVNDNLTALTNDTAYLSVMSNDTGTGIFLSSTDDTALNANCSTAISGTQVAVTCGNGYTGATSFDYTIMDSQAGTDTATASITVAVNNAPSLTVNQPAGGDDSVTTGNNWNINYDLSDAEEVVTVAFYYDTNNSGLDGTLAANCSAAPEGTGVNCAWNTAGVTPGDYYIYGVTSDGIHTNVTDYSSGVVSIIPPVELLAADAGSTENYSGTADSGNITYNIAGSAADNRLLVVSIAAVDTGFSSYVSSMSATYGGQALTEITENTTSNMGSVWMGYLKETGIAAASNSTLAFNNGNTGWDVTKVQIMTFKNVNQTTPLIGAASQSGSTGAVSRVTASLTMGERDMPVYAAVSRNTGGHTVSTTASGTMTELFEELNSASLSSGYKADVKTATSGTITVTFGATEDCAINAAVLRHINN